MHWRVCVQSGKIDWWMSHGGVTRFGGSGGRVTATRGRMTSIVL